MGKTLVLGANGFIGSHLVDTLARRGDDVVAFIRPGSRPKWQQNKGVEAFYGDFLNRSDLQACLNDVDYVYHFISTSTPATTENDPIIDIDTSVRMSVEFFQLCIDSGVKHVFFASTGGSIYGDNPNPPYSENDQTLPFSPYAIGKLSVENYLRYFKKKYGLSSTIFRISNPYGERQPFHRKQGVVPIFIENIYRGRPITVYGDGTMVRDYIFVTDVAEIIAAIGVEGSKYGVYNLGSGEGTSLSTIIKTAEEVVGKKAQIEHLPSPSTFVHTAILDTRRLQEEFPVRALTSIEDGMRMTFRYIKEFVDHEK